MVPVEKLVDAYVIFFWWHTAAASPAIPGLGSITIRLLSCIVAHEQLSLHALPAWHLPTRSSATGLEPTQSINQFRLLVITKKIKGPIFTQSLLLEVLHLQKQ